ncbi:gluconate 2-dehydrogenase subunit 3 family protein [Nitrospirillum bahiense]|uniref:Gluconate 2-dehydrogenase gamma chain n=1 Tax=Nitrospirillum amazonense TaxID=28077 RepID=A0A560FJB1_9PROT|nr:gluconate 2-dehydrogenase subunit 3 family protein [Nitrospirillum amazonense]TWB21687.1 gluconate 2-dehydrogenase gamma chain [Nitrospirillum amazonense]
METKLSRRGLLGAGLAAGAAGALPLAAPGAPEQSARGGGAGPDIRGDMPWQEGAADAPFPADRRAGYIYFTAAEAAFIEAAVGRLIPADELGGGAIEAAVPLFIDRQLDGEYGHASRWYMQGPWAPPLKTQGYQSRMTPAEVYRSAIRAIDDMVAKQHGGASFAKLPPDEQDAVLKGLEANELTIEDVDTKVFFTLLLQNTIEGFFSDPVYGGNKDMIGWRLIGFPGARYDHGPFVERHNQPYPLPPVGITGRPGWTPRDEDGQPKEVGTKTHV